ncbi:DMT family transporter [uncultured Shimia sp.]|uniref:DMT family transporter n=1 Tax=uncultured Shimia sp. TaxID=573152 RepID=UPI0025E92C96|nr:DMT family transporter [uncultured Shimia sp.]
MTRIFTNTRPATAGAFLMIFAGLLFALVNTIVQWGTMKMGLPPTRVAFWQYLIATLWLAPWIVLKSPEALRTKALPKHLLRVGCAVIGVQLWVTGLAHVPIWQAIALIMLSPFFVTVLAGLWLGEQVSAQRWVAVVTGFVGGMMILAPWSDTFTPHALYPVGAAIFWGLTSLMTKQMSGTESPATLTLYLLLLLTPINAGLALDAGLGFEGMTAGLLLIGAGLCTAIAQYALARAYSIADAAYLQPFDHLKLPFNVGLGLVVFGYAPPGSLWLGAALIVGASFALMRQEARLQTA